MNSGDKVTLNGGQSKDEDGDDLTYDWTQSSAPPTVQLDDRTSKTPSFTAPSVNTETKLTFSLIVSDGKSSSNSASVIITVNPPINHAPVASAGGAPADGVKSGNKVTLNGEGSSDSDGDPLRFKWTQVSGSPKVSLSDPGSPRPYFHRPFS